MTIDQQVALDEALVPHAGKLRIGKSNFRLRSDITSKESTLQLATATVHHYSIQFKMDNRKCIVNLEYFREMLHICPRLPGQTFDELPFKEEILAFLRFLGHSREIRKLTDVNINKLHQPWRSFAAIINKFLSGKSTGYDNFIYQVEHKDAKKNNEMYYPRFTKVIIHYFMTKDPSIPRRNKVNWHYVIDDQMFTTIKLVSIHHNTQQFGVMFPVELTNEDIGNSEAYKEYYAVASGLPKTKASVRKMKSSSDIAITPPTTAGTRLSTSTKGKQPAKASKAKGLTVLSEVINRTMDMTIDQQVALDEALVPHAGKLRIGKSNFRLRSDITSKESTLQLATATVHHYLIRFKMDNRKRIVNLEYFREMLHICPRLPGQTFDELPFKEEILAFLRFLGHSREIRKLTDVNINKLHQPWRSFVAVINKFLSGKSTGYNSLWLSHAQILWGIYHKKNVDFA
uniref:Uncharacterized protein n=1 Tax=Tanacetum cinerariifolium TaxID=118510 RepID=A0A699KA73_TANCI|nr:hypothetical protein [Tanacetum cinerariifolium]